MQMSCSIIRTECRIIEFIIGIGCFQLKCINSIIIDVKGREKGWGGGVLGERD